MKYSMILKSPKDYTGPGYDHDKILDFVKSLGWCLSPVQGSYNKWWITSQFVEGKRYQLMNGSKYYKLVINSSDFGIECIGDYNAWSFAGEIRREIKRQREHREAA